MISPEVLQQTAQLVVKHERSEITIREYLKLLLKTLWEEVDGFSGKRPFGNSAWQYDVYKPMVKAGIIPGKFDSFGYAAGVDTDRADEIIQALIASL